MCEERCKKLEAVLAIALGLLADKLMVSEITPAALRAKAAQIRVWGKAAGRPLSARAQWAINQREALADALEALEGSDV